MADQEKLSFTLPDSLLWLMDASLFIDAKLIDEYYDAIVRPIHEEGPKRLLVTEEKLQNLRGKLGIEAKISAGDLVDKLLSLVIKPEVTVTAEGEGEITRKSGNESQIELYPITTPHRRLEQLAVDYLVNHTDRIFLESETKHGSSEWRQYSKILETPRPLVFINLPSLREAEKNNLPKTIIIPTAAEFEDGVVVQLYNRLKISGYKDYPKYPPESERDAGKLKEYWRYFNENLDPVDAMETLENASAEANGRIRWIDFRICLNSDGDSLHLHLCPDEKYDTGSFAYNFIRRGYKYGFRLVGMLKSGPDMNVLAVFEK